MAWQNTIERQWDGATDGNWSTFQLQVGTPPQTFFALVSTRRSWLRLSFAWNPTSCVSNTRGEFFFDCENHQPRFGSWPAFEPCSSSTTKVIKGCTAFDEVFDDGMQEQHEYILNGTEHAQMTGHMASAEAFAPCEFPEDNMATIGLLPIVEARNKEGKGLYPKEPLDFTRTGFIQSFRAFHLESNAPLKLVYGYTAGAYYRSGGYPASLTIGSIDQSRIGNTSITLPLGFLAYWPGKDGTSDPTRSVLDLHLHSLSSSGTIRPGSDALSLQRTEFMTQTIWVRLDPELPYLELPEEVCHRMAEAFQLDFDPDSSRFFISEAARARLRELRPSFTLTVGYKLMNYGEAPDMNITLPYEAFEHNIFVDGGNRVPYFPIRISPMAHKGTWILGRVFFQEA